MQLVRHECEGEDPVEHVRDDLDGRGLAAVAEQRSHQSPELVVVRGVVADVPGRRVLLENHGGGKFAWRVNQCRGTKKKHCQDRQKPSHHLQ